MSEKSKFEKQTFIEEHVRHTGYSVQEWREGEDGLEGSLGKFRANEDNEDAGVYADTEGELVVSIAGAGKYHNERVHLAWVEEGMSEGMEVSPSGLTDGTFEPVDD